VEDLANSGDLFAAGMPGRITYLTDPVLGGMRPAQLDRAGQLVADDSGVVEPMPAVLFEPVRVVMIKNTESGMVQEAKTEAIIASGFRRIPDLPAWRIDPAPGWEVQRLPDGLALRDSSGEIWASSEITLDPAWISAATSYRYVVAFYGPKLGVRVPPRMNAASYTTARRAAEFREGRRQGLISAATVTWHGELTDETLDWVTFLPGSFGQPFPGLFAPIANFTMHGGPDMFGLTRVSDHDLAVPAEPVQTLVAQVSRTDIDLLDPADTRVLGQIGGVHYSEGLPTEWRQAALGNGRILLISGRRLPGLSGSSARQSSQALRELWAAFVPVQPG
jgi:hypothetical protein